MEDEKSRHHLLETTPLLAVSPVLSASAPPHYKNQDWEIQVSSNRVIPINNNGGKGLYPHDPCNNRSTSINNNNEAEITMAAAATEYPLRRQEQQRPKPNCCHRLFRRFKPKTFGVWMLNSFFVHIQGLLVLLMSILFLGLSVTPFLFVTITTEAHGVVQAEAWAQGFFQDQGFFEHILPQNRTGTAMWSASVQEMTESFSLLWLGPVEALAFLVLFVLFLTISRLHKKMADRQKKKKNQTSSATDILFTTPPRSPQPKGAWIGFYVKSILRVISLTCFVFVILAVLWLCLLPHVCDWLHFGIEHDQVLQDTFNSESNSLEGKWWANVNGSAWVKVSCNRPFESAPMVIIFVAVLAGLLHISMQLILHWKFTSQQHKKQRIVRFSEQEEEEYDTSSSSSFVTE